MVNLDKWEKINHSQINFGDTIKRVNVHEDGTRAEVTGVVMYETYDGTFQSKMRFDLIRKHYANTTTELFRLIPPTQEELDEAFEFPKGVGAVIEVVEKKHGDSRTFVHTGKVWHWSETQYPAALSEKDVRQHNHTFKIISEGIN